MFYPIPVGNSGEHIFAYYLSQGHAPEEAARFTIKATEVFKKVLREHLDEEDKQREAEYKQREHRDNLRRELDKEVLRIAQASHKALECQAVVGALETEFRLIQGKKSKVKLLMKLKERMQEAVRQYEGIIRTESAAAKEWLLKTDTYRELNETQS